MRKAFHYTLERCYDFVRREGVLPASRGLISLGYKWGIPELWDIGPKGNFIFALLEKEPESWKNNGFLETLFNMIKGKIKGKRKEELVLLSFPVIDSDQAFVLEAKPTYELEHQRMNPVDAFKEYVQSMTELRQYNDDFEIPELVIGNDIPLSRITLEGTLS